MHKQTQFQNHGPTQCRTSAPFGGEIFYCRPPGCILKMGENRGPHFLERYLPWRLSLGQAHKMKAKHSANYFWRFRDFHLGDCLEEIRRGTPFAKVTQIASARFCRFILGCFPHERFEFLTATQSVCERIDQLLLRFARFREKSPEGLREKYDWRGSVAARQTPPRAGHNICGAFPHRWQDDLLQNVPPICVRGDFRLTSAAVCLEICQPDQVSFATIVIAELISEQIELALQFGGRHSFARGNLPKIFICNQPFRYRFA